VVAVGEDSLVRRFNWNLLVPLDALLQEKSVTAAAKVVRVGQSTMSGMLAQLRGIFDDPLLVRIGHTTELTPRGKELAVEVRQVVLSMERFTTIRKDFEPTQCCRHFRIMASQGGLLLVLSKLFHRLVRDAPGVTLEVLPIDKPVESVYLGTVDISLTGDRISNIEGEAATFVRTQMLYEESFVGVVDINHELREALTLEDFSAYPHVVTQFSHSPWSVEEVTMNGLIANYSPQAKVPEFLAVGSFVADTEAIGIVPRRLVPFLQPAEKLRTLALPEDFAVSPIRLLWHVRYDGDLEHKWLRQLIVKICNEMKL
jgi:DNA-binding transcriptional LysR family regulator